MKKLLKEFRQSRKSLFSAIKRFPIRFREEVLFDKWSLKDVVAHINGWDVLTIEAIKTFKKSRFPKWGTTVAEFNKISVLKRKKWSWNKVFAEFKKLGVQIHKEYSSLPEELWNKKIYRNRSFTPKTFLKIDIHRYAKEHLPVILKTSKKISKTNKK
ncbi:MAG: hypothetical protein A2391_01545 [Candidatus Brennerbacteria bacterium RIFOXYB1_FULL_41_13]|uniref:DinB-like domain-containing protein n=1 Tax=Candidatus Brennerbacteria bacterium RIFOXYD1_FULL_41_16 TaxID=1797529 RepID=A0A1G1XKC7_9BACT|nr:MAG: hypothetical protein A2391_01545 [Candidatus Brennerbacteria bacterium RIFOXYB1_FULL_41_13]OGY40354.1 MAG: hypothetical protein A2570_03710 [Candidatus Brennerbacteria bacterium RIFOXYD1_FULL_41_16]